MTERPIIFNDAMVRAVLSGVKTQTRRPIKPQPIDAYCGQPKTKANPRGMSSVWTWWLDDGRKGADIGTCPFGVPGDKLWVREAWRVEWGDTLLEYRSNGASEWLSCDQIEELAVRRWSDKLAGGKWAPSIHMSRWASRTTLDVLGVGVERLQDITEEGACAEGFDPIPAHRSWVIKCRSKGGHWSARPAFAAAWDAIYPAAPWSSNPWVWRIDFRRTT